MKSITSTLVAVALVLALATSALAGGRPGGGGGGDRVSLTIAVDCDDNPETVTITNDLDATLNVATIGSLDDPREDEPFRVFETDPTNEIEDGDSATYFSGSDAPEGDDNTLTQQFIFDDDAADEGVRVSIGPEGITGQEGPLEFEVLCAEGEETFVFTRGGEQPGMPNTGAGGAAGTFPGGGLAATLPALWALGYALLRRR